MTFKYFTCFTCDFRVCFMCVCILSHASHYEYRVNNQTLAHFSVCVYI